MNKSQAIRLLPSFEFDFKSKGDQEPYALNSPGMKQTVIKNPK